MKQRLLVVEDDDTLRSLLRRGFPLVEIDNYIMMESGSKALDVLRAEAENGRPFDVILTDLDVDPNSANNGLTVLTEAHKLMPAASLWLMTAGLEKTDLKTGEQAKNGITFTVFSKPFPDFKAFLEALKDELLKER